MTVRWELVPCCAKPHVVGQKELSSAEAFLMPAVAVAATLAAPFSTDARTCGAIMAQPRALGGWGAQGSPHNLRCCLEAVQAIRLSVHNRFTLSWPTSRLSNMSSGSSGSAKNVGSDPSPIFRCTTDASCMCITTEESLLDLKILVWFP